MNTIPEVTYYVGYFDDDLTFWCIGESPELQKAKELKESDSRTVIVKKTSTFELHKD